MDSQDEWTHPGHMVCNWEPSRGAQAVRDMEGRSSERQGSPITAGLGSNGVSCWCRKFG